MCNLFKLFDLAVALSKWYVSAAIRRDNLDDLGFGSQYLTKHTWDEAHEHLYGGGRLDLRSGELIVQPRQKEARSPLHLPYCPATISVVQMVCSIKVVVFWDEVPPTREVATRFRAKGARFLAMVNAEMPDQVINLGPIRKHASKLPWLFEVDLRPNQHSVHAFVASRRHKPSSSEDAPPSSPKSNDKHTLYNDAGRLFPRRWTSTYSTLPGRQAAVRR